VPSTAGWIQTLLPCSATVAHTAMSLRTLLRTAPGSRCGLLFESGDFDALLVIVHLHSSRADRQCWEMQTFDLEKSKADIEAVVRDNTFMAELQVRTPDPQVMFVCFDHCIGSVLLLLHGHQARLCQCLKKSCIAPAGAHRATYCGARHVLAALLLPAAPAEGGGRAACRAGSPRLGTARRGGTVDS
jgi:hypothetical protein